MVTVDLAVFAWIDRLPKVLLVRRRSEPFARTWAIPGGFLDLDESPEAGARRELREETGLTVAGPVEPIGFFGAPGRDPRGRTITLAHAAVLGPGDHRVEGADDASEAAWHTLDEEILLAFDHAEILRAARKWLLRGLIDRGLGLALLGGEFTTGSIEAIRRALGFQDGNSPE
jgi:8-oxo-dGTP diphosphatase